MDTRDLPLLLLIVFSLREFYVLIQSKQLTAGQFTLFSCELLLKCSEVAVVLVYRAVR